MRTWARFLKLLLGVFAGLVLAAMLLTVIANPYGNLPVSMLGRHVIMDDNQRFQYPAIIRSGNYDSLVIGTSTARLLEPAALEEAFGGRFANLALNSGTAWEQWRVARLFAEAVARPRTLLVGLDHVWCRADADRNRITPRGFPEWMFDDNPWNDAAYMLNTRTLEIAGRRIGYALGLVPERWPQNGYEVFVPPEGAYDLARVREHIYGKGGAPRATEPVVVDMVSPAEADAHDTLDAFPALAWLRNLAQDKRFARVVFLITPVHMAAQPKPGTREAEREARCKDQIRRIAQDQRISAVDFRIPSPITTRDENYWDALHYRVPVATRIVGALAHALKIRRDDPAGNWRVLNMAP